MKKRTKVLFPTDFTQPAASAFKYTLLLCHALDADLEVMHVTFPQSEPLDIPVMAAQATQQKVDVARELMDTFVATGLKAVEDQLDHQIQIETAIELGSPVRAIVRIAERDGADLIVMGTRGERTGLGRLLGSVAAGVVDKAHCTVIVVPEETAFKEPGNVAFATDITDADPFVIWKLTQLLSPFKVIIHCVHFNMTGDMSDDFEKMEQMKSFFENRTPAVQLKFYHLPGKKLEIDINQFVEDYHMDMLVMVRPHRGMLENLFHQSQVKRMAVSSNVPLLVQREER
ncbi:MAG: universal stress protein [Bacteroidota bacterium]